MTASSYAIPSFRSCSGEMFPFSTGQIAGSSSPATRLYSHAMFDGENYMLSSGRYFGPFLAGLTSRVTTASSACSSSAPLRPAPSNISFADYSALSWAKPNAAMTTSSKPSTTAAPESLILLSSSCAWRYYTHSRAGLLPLHFKRSFSIVTILRRSVQKFFLLAVNTSVNFFALFLGAEV